MCPNIDLESTRALATKERGTTVLIEIAELPREWSTFLRFDISCSLTIPMWEVFGRRNYARTESLIQTNFELFYVAFEDLVSHEQVNLIPKRSNMPKLNSFEG
jgi:hypothetical protein